MNLILIATAPVAIILFYIYIRDKYEKEPVKLLLKALLGGCLITIPVIFFEQLTIGLIQPYFFDNFSAAFGNAFMVASFWEETFKYLAVWVLFWQSRHFNERFDGIVYAVFVSLGFALVENILYVLPSDEGLNVGLSRAITAVPAHAIFGVAMGYYFGLAKFSTKYKVRNLTLAFVFPFILHGIYDFLLMANHRTLLALFFPFLIAIYILAHRKISYLSQNSMNINEEI